jgi:hypothetical protein
VDALERDMSVINEQRSHHQLWHRHRCVQGAALTNTTKYVTISIGGNDLDFKDVILKCMTLVDVDIWPPGAHSVSVMFWRHSAESMALQQQAGHDCKCGSASHLLSLAHCSDSRLTKAWTPAPILAQPGVHCARSLRIRTAVASPEPCLHAMQASLAAVHST